MKIHGLDLDNSPLISQDKALRFAQNIAIGEGNQSYINEDGFNEKLDYNNDIRTIINNHENNLISDTDILHVIGTIPTNIGIVLLCVIYDKDESNDFNNINYKCDIICYIEDYTIKTLIYDTDYSLKFNINRPIHGDYIYNYKQELIITFTEGISEEANETRILNLSDPDGSDIVTNIWENETNEDDIHYKFKDVKLYEIITPTSLNLIPDVEYPTMDVIVETGGNLKSGAYQIAIAYKL